MAKASRFMRLSVVGAKRTLAITKHIQQNFPKFGKELSILFARGVQKQVKRHIMARKKYGRTNKLGIPALSSLPLESSFLIMEHGVNKVVLSSMLPWSAAVEYGTKPHTIPTNPIWGLRGRIHPGARPMFYMRDAIIDVEPWFRSVSKQNTYNFFKTGQAGG